MRKYGVVVLEMRLDTDAITMVLDTPLPTMPLFMQLANSRIAVQMNRRQKMDGKFWRERYKSTVLEPGEPEEAAIAQMYEGLGGASARLHGAFDGEARTARFYAFGRLVHVEQKNGRWYVRWEDVAESAESGKSSQKRSKRKGGRKKGGKRGKGKSSAGRHLVRAWELAIVQSVLRWKKVYGSPEFVRRILNTYLREGRRRAGPERPEVASGEALPARCADCPVAALAGGPGPSS
jgi:hypothetical protein